MPAILQRINPWAAFALVLALALPLAAQPREDEPSTNVPVPSAPEAYRSVHAAPPAWLQARFKSVMAEINAPGWDGPRANPKLVRAFLYETYEHIHEVNALSKAIGGRARPIPATAAETGPLRGIHDLGERVSLVQLEAFIAEAKRAPLKHFRTGLEVPVPEWLERLAQRARASGRKSVDIGKLSPYVAAGLSQPNVPERYAIELHRLSAHHGHGEKLKGSVLIETIADRINAMRQVRVYSKTPMPYEKIKAIVLGDVGKGLPLGTEGLVLEALKAQRHLERTGKANPYQLLEKPAKPGSKADRWARHRRADGTLKWGELTAKGAFKTGGGMAHFGLALFLKELALVAATGDRVRLEEFFDALQESDFYVHYGLFALGAAGGEVAYARYLQRFVRPRFVSTILKTNIALATGLALPQLLSGEFKGKAFAISLGSLGLSASAVRSGVRGIAWVRDLSRARRGVAPLAAAGRLARAGGWFYTVAETAVVLLLAEQIEQRVNAWQDAEAARDALSQAGRALQTALADPQATPDSIAAASAANHEAWGAYRDFLYRPLLADDALLAERLQRVAREAKLADDLRRARVEKARTHPALRARLERKHGSLEAYAEARSREADAAQAAKVSQLLEGYERSRRGKLQKVYGQDRRESELLEGVEHLDWLLTSGADGAQGDPYTTRSDWGSRLGRRRIRAGLDDALRGASPNRLQAFEDEAALLSAAAKALEDSGRSDLARPLREQALRALDERSHDRRSVTGGGVVTLEPEAKGGALDALRRGLGARQR